jgi:hypothetical protein
MVTDVACGTVLWAVLLLRTPEPTPPPTPRPWVDAVLGGTLVLVTLFVLGSAVAAGIDARPCTHTAWAVDLTALVIAACALGWVAVSWRCGKRRLANSVDASTATSTSRLSGKSAGVSPVSNGSCDSGIRRSPLEGVTVTTTSTPMHSGPSKPLRLLIPAEAMSAKSPCPNDTDTSWVLVADTAPAYPYATTRPDFAEDANTLSTVKGDNDGGTAGLVNISLNNSNVDSDVRSVSAKSVLSASVQYAGDLDGANLSPVAASPATHSASGYAIPRLSSCLSSVGSEA